MDITVNHNLGIEEAKKRILTLGDQLKKEYGSNLKNYEENWNGNSGTFEANVMGAKIEGALDIFENKVSLNGRVPLMFKMFEGQIQNQIEKTLLNLLK